MLVEYGGHVHLNRHWAQALLERMGFVKRKGTTSKNKHSVSGFKEIKKEFLQEVVQIVEMEEICGELILNWNQTGLNIVPSSSWTMGERGSKRVEIVGAKDKRQITTVFCGTLVGDFLPVQLIFKGKTSRCHPHYKLPAWWHVTHPPNHWSTEQTMLEYIKHIVIPYIQSVRESKGEESLPALVIMDNFKGQATDNVKALLEENNVHISFVPPNTTDLLQPLDVSVNKPAKSFLRQKFDE